MTDAPVSAAPMNVAAASTQLGAWNATTSPGPTPSAASAPATRADIAARSATVPMKGRTSERNSAGASMLPAMPAASTAPIDSSVQSPSAR